MVNHTNITNLQTMNQLNLNMSGLNDSSLIINTVQNTVKSNIGNFWFIVSIIALFLFLTWLFYKKDGQFLYDTARSTTMSAVFCFFISVGFLLSGWITTIIPLLWFASISFIGFMGVLKLKSKGL